MRIKQSGEIPFSGSSGPEGCCGLVTAHEVRRRVNTANNARALVNDNEILFIAVFLSYVTGSVGHLMSYVPLLIYRLCEVFLSGNREKFSIFFKFDVLLRLKLYLRGNVACGAGLRVAVGVDHLVFTCVYVHYRITVEFVQHGDYG